MIPKQTPVRNFRPAAPPQTSLFSSLPLAPPRKSASSSSLIRPLCVQSQTLYRNHLRRQVRPRIACCITLPTSSSVPPFPQDLSQEKSFRASRPSSPNLPLPENRTRRKCLVSQSFAAARPLPHRLPSCTAASSSVPPFRKVCPGKVSSAPITFLSKHAVAKRRSATLCLVSQSAAARPPRAVCYLALPTSSSVPPFRKVCPGKVSSAPITFLSKYTVAKRRSAT